MTPNSCYDLLLNDKTTEMKCGPKPGKSKREGCLEIFVDKEPCLPDEICATLKREAIVKKAPAL